MNPYHATFELARGRRRVALLHDTPEKQLDPLGLARLADWLTSCPVDFAVRVEHGARNSQCAVWLHAGEEHERRFIRAVDELAAFTAPTLVPCTSAEAFDARAGIFSPLHLSLEPMGMRWKNFPVATETSAVPIILGMMRQAFASHGRIAFQAAFEQVDTHDKELQRAVRKHLVSLQHRELPSRVQETQSILLQRLLEPGWVWSAVLGVENESMLESCLATARHIQEDFPGGTQPTVHEFETVDKMDELLTGFHPSQFRGEAWHPADMASERLSRSDARQFLLETLQRPASSHRPSPPPGSVPPTFISYSARDYAAAAELRDHLEGSGLPCWMAPRDIPPGVDYPGAIIRALDQCRALVLVHSQLSNASPHVIREVERTLHRRKPIIPVVVDSSRPSGAMEYLLSTCQRIDATGEKRPGAFAQLTLQLASLPTPPPPQPGPTTALRHN